MVLLCNEIDKDGAEETKRVALTEGILVQMVGTDVVQPTTLTRKVTYAGKTVVYPVYKVRPDALYYNDQKGFWEHYSL